MDATPTSQEGASTSTLGPHEPGAAAANGSSSGHVWDEASSPGVLELTRRFEDAWRARGASGARPDPETFLTGPLRESPGARLALLRADMALRWEAGERARVEDYRERVAGLPDESLVALLYEEFCLREEHGEAPDPAEFLDRFPQLADRLRRVLSIHDLVGPGSGASTALHGPPDDDVLMPEVGQTIAGFTLVEELGRGAFARVFLAEERQLADRPVALKVARGGSGEPQTLARLQHTHIVPIYSYRTDPATGLHLLCMPYFGRVTLARLLAEERVKTARGGAEVLRALAQLDPKTTPTAAPPPRFAELPYARAIAWWGARLAEALQHAHDRGVLHRDIKPSNVLITPDGLPMLLDFNLAQVQRGEVGALGGTYAYMAPEHLEALADGDPGRVDARADIYALGVVLFEAMGTRPFADAPPAGPSRGLVDALHRAAAERRAGAPRLRVPHPETPAPYEAVVRRCLAPDPADRYPTAGALAADLQAVADDGPLRLARESLPSRALRWVRRHRGRVAWATAAALVVLIGFIAAHEARFGYERVTNKVREWLREGDAAVALGRTDQAQDYYALAENMARRLPGLEALAQRARERQYQAREGRRIAERAEGVLAAAERLHLALLRRGGDARAAGDELRRLLQPLLVFKLPVWTDLPELTLLPEAERARLVREVEELMFLWAVALAVEAEHDDNPAACDEVIALCARALAFSSSPEPWQALRDRCRSAPDALAVAPGAAADGRGPLRIHGDPARVDSAWTCLQWGLLADRIADDPARAVVWLDRGVRLDPSQAWAQHALAVACERAGQPVRALDHYGDAIALAPDDIEAYLSRARALRRLGQPEAALADLDTAAGLIRDRGGPWVRLALAYLVTAPQRPEAWPRLAALLRDIAGPAGKDDRVDRPNMN
jgi:serine/threonine protein kinase